MRQLNSDISPEGAGSLWRESLPVPCTTITATCKLITPMYGGGVKAGAVDPNMPIRASALRGQLRSWWRLLHSRDRPSTEVFEDECALWGGISSKGPQASQVVVRVACRAVEDSRLIDGKPPDVPDYVLIWNRDEPPPKLLNQGYEFELSLELRCVEERREQVVEALRWWASFSGVGARTRRGLGAVRVNGTEVKPVHAKEVEDLGGQMVVGPATPKARAAWGSAIKQLSTFRQGPGMGRGGGNRPGRSNWPEADTIRRVAGKWAHDPRHPVDGVYPRAAFGLPIVFHFKDAKDPSDTLELAGQERERMASPLILRPYFNGETYHSLALLLPGWKERIGVPVALSKLGKDNSVKAWPDDMEERKRLASRIAPMQDRGEDVLTAFMQYFRDQIRPRQGRAHR